ncbi:AtpZ/AtpI family protein [Geotoga petraea]|uniref:AtpZ/AtpI family protein n=1 Tax=Geotoga petraea TaxID=28234 RepID=A0A1G6MZB2_9BACT|nr:AtpZ/AtpI family protein [Geotoga petraea]MDK2945914.1 synthase protein [Geotoga sp.]TGG87287.1 AtpZ/AtpI family protein [Geotoga petraea]SDC60919.1 Putative F0F1-ATPase subunit Ca2+/Mg2+ transporter [Geotoga petraea]
MKLDLNGFNQLNMILMFGITVLSNIFVGLGLGWIFDEFFNQNFFKIIFMFLGIASGLYFGIKDLIREADKYDKAERTSKKTDDKNDNNFDN